jgi:hypothetical protein
MKKYLLSIIVFLTLFATSTWASGATISPALTNEMEVCSQENISIELSGNRLRVRNASGEQLEIYSVTGKKVELFRAPYGDYNDLLIDTATELNLYTIQWDVDSLDWKDLSASEITSRVLKRVKKGSIVLFHNQGLHTAEALPSIITALKSQGYKFVSIGELIYRDNYTMLSDGGQQRNS